MIMKSLVILIALFSSLLSPIVGTVIQQSTDAQDSIYSPIRKRSVSAVATTGSAYAANNMFDNFVGVSTDSTGNYVATIGKTTGIYLSSTTGSTYTLFTPIPTGYNYLAVAIASNSPQFVAAVTSYGVIYTTNFGSTFQKSNATISSSGYWTAIAISDDGKYAYIVSNNLNLPVYASTNSMSSFTKLTGSATDYFYGVATSSNGQYVYALTSRKVYISNNYGKNFFYYSLISSSSTPPASGYSIACSADGSTTYITPYSVVSTKAMGGLPLRKALIPHHILPLEVVYRVMGKSLLRL
jgi:hypothetical protein